MALAFEMRISGSLVSPLHGDSFIYSLAADQANFPGVRVLLCPTLPHAEINSEERGKAQKKPQLSTVAAAGGNFSWWETAGCWKTKCTEKKKLLINCCIN